MSTSTWNVSANGSWGTPADWLGGVPNSSATDAVISHSGAYRVTVNQFQEFAVHDVTLNNATATLDIEGALDLAGTLNLMAGNLHLDGAINGGTIAAGSGDITFGECVLTGVAWEGALNIDVANNSGAILVTVAGGLTLTGANGKGAGSLSIEGSANFDSALDVTGTETLNNATLTFGGFNGALDGGGSSASSALTLGSNFVIKQSGADNNLDGTIVNDGVINVTAGKLTDVGAFTNNGAITVGNGAAFVFDGTTTFGALGQLTTSGSGDFAVSYAAVLSGILNASNANFEFVAGTLSGVTWEGPLTISAPAGSDEGLTVNVMGGLTLTRAGGLGLGSGSLNIDGSLTTVILNVEDSETLYNATLTFGGSNGYLTSGYSGGSETPGILTLARSFTVTQSSGSNYLQSQFYYYNDQIYADGIVNDGNIEVSGGDLTDSGNLVNNGLIDVSGGTFTTTGIPPFGLGAFTNNGTVKVDGGTLALEYGTFANLSGGVLTGGSYVVDAGSVIQLAENAQIVTDDADITLSGAGSSIQSTNSENSQVAIDSTLTTIGAAGSLSILGGRNFTTASTFTNDGVLHVAGGVFTTAGLTNLSGGTLTGGTWSVGRGGTLQLPDNAPVTTDDATIILTGAGSAIRSLDTTSSQQVTIDSTLMAIGASGALSILGGRSFTAASPFTNDGVLQIAGGAFTAPALTNLSNGTLTGGTWSVGAGGTLQLPDNAPITTDDATIILSGAESAIQSLETTSSRQATIESSLTAIGTSGTLEILGGRNYATSKSVINSGVLQLGGGALATGGLTDAAGSTLSGFGAVAGRFSGAAVTAVGGQLAFSGAGDSFAGSIGGTGTLVIDGGSSTLMSGLALTVAGVSIEGAAVTLAGSLSYGGTFSYGGGKTTLALGANTLSLGGISMLGGPISGAAGSALALTGGMVTIDSRFSLTGAGLTIADGVTVTTDVSLKFAGALTDGAASVNLDDKMVTLTGPVSFTGSSFSGLGEVVVRGATAIAGLALGGPIKMLNYGPVTESAQVTIGRFGSKSASIINEAGGVWDITTDSGIAAATGSLGYMVNYGEFEKTAGSATSTIAVPFANDGAIDAASGTLDFATLVAGKGTMTITDGATLLLNGEATSTQTIGFGTGGGALALTAPRVFFASVSGLGAGDGIDLRGFAFTGRPQLHFSENAANTGGTLKVTDGGQTATIALLGQYVAAGFEKAPDSGTGTLITYTPPSPGLELAAGHH